MTDRALNITRCAMRLVILAALFCVDAVPVLSQAGLDQAGQWMTLGKAYAPKLDHGYSWGVDGTIDITSDFGFLVGIGPTYSSYAYREEPYLYKMGLVGAVAMPSWRWKVLYSFFMPSLGNRLALELKAGVSTVEVINFYGFGSDTPRDMAKEETGYYDVDATVYATVFYLGFGLSPTLWLGPAVGLNYMDMRNAEGRLIGETDPVLIGTNQLYLGPGLQLYSDTRERSLYPRSGTFLFAAGHNWFATMPGHRPYYQVAADFRWYGSVSRIPDVVLALRFSGLATFGEVPFYQTARLGGRRNVRGYEFERYRGDHTVAGSADLRFPFYRDVIFIPVEFGGFLMADAGRLWYEKESPGGWRGSWGFGIWGATLSRDVLGILYIAFSRENAIVRAGFGFDY